MATLDTLKGALREEAGVYASASKKPLSDLEYGAGFDILKKASESTAYQNFIIPQLNLVLSPLLNSRIGVSVLEVGPGPESVLGHLPIGLRRKVKAYTALEPNAVFATRLEKWLCSATKAESPLPCLDAVPDIRQRSFSLDADGEIESETDAVDGVEAFDVVLFCHSMYGMKPKRRFIQKALQMLGKWSDGGLVIVFHRSGTLHLHGLASHRTASFPNGMIRMPDDDAVLDLIAPFIAGFKLEDAELSKTPHIEWRKVCRVLGRREKAHPGHLLFHAPEYVMAFTRHASMVPELLAQVPVASVNRQVKNREARLHYAASNTRPTKIEHIQQSVRWARQHGLSLTVIGGGHSGQCLWPNVVSLDMSAFNQVHVLSTGEKQGPCINPSPLIVVETGCTTGDLISKAMEAGLTVPLGSRPSVGAGLWLQGGIGHLARVHGLTCDAIVGATIVSVDSGQVICVGRVPRQYQPAGAQHPESENDVLWAIKGAGTNFGIVVSVTFKAFTARTYRIRDWIVPLCDTREARLTLHKFDQRIVQPLPRNCSVDAYLYWEAGKLRLGVTMSESSTTKLTSGAATLKSSSYDDILGPGISVKTVDSVGLFETEMYMSGMHGGHAGGKTSSFKRCIFLKDIGAAVTADALVAAVQSRPSPLCYLHLLHGGGAIADVAEDATAFGCRDWDFACVITGVWPRHQDGTEIAQAAIQWVYTVAQDLLPLSGGAYGADLGPDPRDAALALKAFGNNRPRLARLKHSLDPGNVLAYACPLLRGPMKPKLVVLVTGESGAGKDFCAEVWTSAIAGSSRNITARTASISDAIKREYAQATGADLGRLLGGRAYKEQHRPDLTTYFQNQVRQRPQLPEEQFLSTLFGAVGVDVLFITGMRDEAPMAAFSHLLPDSKLIEVRVQTSKLTRHIRRGRPGARGDDDNHKGESGGHSTDCPSYTFDNESTGDAAARAFAARYLIPLVSGDLQRLASMLLLVPDFPQQDVEFKHILNIPQQRGGLALCTSLLQTHFAGDWTKVDSLVSCEVGGIVFASALAVQVDVPLALIRAAGKLPPPTLSVIKTSSYISSSIPRESSPEQRMEMGRDAVSRGAAVVVVDDVLASGNTICAVLQLLREAGVRDEDVSVMVVAEFPVHRGRKYLCQRGFGSVKIQSLLVFGGA
ncbi:hypothetical protein NLU13_3552 [Sarocladium strictum]|uniref:FAD-binding PCMH-type domain-containing protein n=1 Tax=Sarocladium strictum TaxID=5046 RepID=A0AA39GP29_SARSR|nr:hypothetical protein NLU13_3552 [Sarocladium strictum]